MRRTIGPVEYNSMAVAERAALDSFVKDELDLNLEDCREITYDSQGEIVVELLLRDEAGMAYISKDREDSAYEVRSFTRLYDPDGPWVCTGRTVHA